MKYILPTLALLGLINVVYTCQLRSYGRHETPGVMMPLNVEDTAERYNAGKYCTDRELEALSRWMEEHPEEWNKWSADRNTVTF